MPSGKKLLRDMKMFVQREGLDPDEWLYIKNQAHLITLIHRETGEIKKLYKGRKQA